MNTRVIVMIVAIVAITWFQPINAQEKPELSKVFTQASANQAINTLTNLLIQEGKYPIAFGRGKGCIIEYAYDVAYGDAPLIELHGTFWYGGVQFSCSFVFDNDTPNVGPILKFFTVKDPSSSDEPTFRFPTEYTNERVVRKYMLEENKKKKKFLQLAKTAKLFKRTYRR